ncbi:MAG: MogA/MoaB family molybdenum cofactor biosynthesis protein [Terriglobales bacterium]
MPPHIRFRFPASSAPRAVIVITVSDRSARGERPDASGPALAALLSQHGFEVTATAVVPDRERPLIEALRTAARAARLVITTGGTGFSPRDHTPEATARVLDRPAPGLAEAMRAAGAQKTPRAWLSRGLAGLRGRTLILNLPGSPTAACESLAAVLPLLPHALDVAAGKDRHEG